MAISISTDLASAAGLSQAGAGPDAARAQAQGRLALAEDGETVVFVPLDPPSSKPSSPTTKPE